MLRFWNVWKTWDFLRIRQKSKHSYVLYVQYIILLYIIKYNFYTLSIIYSLKVILYNTNWVSLIWKFTPPVIICKVWDLEHHWDTQVQIVDLTRESFRFSILLFYVGGRMPRAYRLSTLSGSYTSSPKLKSEMLWDTNHFFFFFFLFLSLILELWDRILLHGSGWAGIVCLARLTLNLSGSVTASLSPSPKCLSTHRGRNSSDKAYETFVCLFETGSHSVAQASLEFTMYPKLASKVQ